MKTIKHEEMIKQNKTIAYNILQYQYPNLSKEAIRQSCCRASKIQYKKSTKNILQETDNKILDFMYLKPMEKKKFDEKTNNLKKYIDKL